MTSKSTAITFLFYFFLELTLKLCGNEFHFISVLTATLKVRQCNRQNKRNLRCCCINCESAIVMMECTNSTARQNCTVTDSTRHKRHQPGNARCRCSSTTAAAKNTYFYKSKTAAPKVELYPASIHTQIPAFMKSKQKICDVSNE